MSNFYSKRFLSALMGALSVLSSPVASARDDKLGKGNLKGRGGASARRDKNNGKLGGLESNRKVKSVNDLEKVLKETGGKVVGVSPDGKGGFVAFVKTPTGKVVTVAIVGVPLAVIIYCLVCFGRKNGEGIEGSNISIKESEKIITVEGPVEYIKAEENIKSKGNKKMTVFEGTNGSVGDDQLKYSGKLLEKLFDNDDKKYNLFVNRLLSGVFDMEAFIKEFDKCNGNLDEFLKVVFDKSSFDGGLWDVDEYSAKSTIVWSGAFHGALTFGFTPGSTFADPVNVFLVAVFGYLSIKEIVLLPDDNVDADADASWGDKISAVLFGFWCSVKFNFDIGPLPEATLEAEGLDSLKNTFEIIRNYVNDRLKAASKGYDGQELKPVG